MKKMTAWAVAALLLAGCQKEMASENGLEKTLNTAPNAGKKVTRPIASNLQSDPDPNPTTPFGTALFYGTITHMGTVYGKSVNQTGTFLTPTDLALTSDDISYAANGDQLWTKGDIVIHYPTDGSTTATITGGSKIVGGTGRFAGATGYFIYENMVYDIVTGHESHTGYGEITF